MVGEHRVALDMVGEHRVALDVVGEHRVVLDVVGEHRVALDVVGEHRVALDVVGEHCVVLDVVGEHRTYHYTGGRKGAPSGCFGLVSLTSVNGSWCGPPVAVGRSKMAALLVLHVGCLGWNLFGVWQNVEVTGAASRHGAHTFGGRWKYLTFINQVRP
ncbi:hypothetical protein GDO86_014580 [Hymenochirus boettgeri]|uniref:Uncharacterized protein n=1 Tax=Hymenochirus boettgeri TaxID=247094 RepID=A0A8T2JTG1_9PIPI|nr:hypothetical protein GDO86_014580 [Hymenochirus boettgeri]